MACPNNVGWCNGPGSFGPVCLSCKKGKQSVPDLSERKAVVPYATARPSSGSPPRVAKPEPVKPLDVASTSHSFASTSTSATTTPTPPSKERPWTIAGKTISGESLGVGSYKSAWAIDDDPTHVFVTVASDKRSMLTTEMTSLQTLAKAGCRVVDVSEAIYEAPGGQIGVIMEKLDGTEIKETRFNMTTQKQAILGAAPIYGIEKTCAQFQAVADFIDRRGGISDLQFVVSGRCGAVLFDPATLGTTETSGNLTAMISYLRQQTIQ